MFICVSNSHTTHQTNNKIQYVPPKYTVITPFTIPRCLSKVVINFADLRKVNDLENDISLIPIIKTFKTLIVEDNDTFRQALTSLLDSRFPSMVFEEARDGEEAIDKVYAFDPDLIFMDIKLPGESGLELTKRIRHSNFKVKIIILTSYDLPEYREAARLGGANHFVSKGLSKTEDILALVDTILAERVQ